MFFCQNFVDYFPEGEVVVGEVLHQYFWGVKVGLRGGACVCDPKEVGKHWSKH